ncbi:MAG TPA: hypothetical protein VGG39_24980 [Polyangiaceae bacterium]|jgi:hypothetical protein
MHEKSEAEFDWATLKQIARVFEAHRGAKGPLWQGLMQQATYAGLLASAIARREVEDLERRDRLDGLGQCFLAVALAQVGENEKERQEAWHELEELLGEESRWWVAFGQEVGDGA